jgi:hypothetical protein
MRTQPAAWVIVNIQSPYRQHIMCETICDGFLLSLEGTMPPEVFVTDAYIRELSESPYGNAVRVADGHVAMPVERSVHFFILMNQSAPLRTFGLYLHIGLRQVSTTPKV